MLPTRVRTCKASLLDHAAPARSAAAPRRIPDDDQQGAVFLRVPAPEAAPGYIRPKAAEDRSGETQQRGEADDAIGHSCRPFSRPACRRPVRRSTRNNNTRPKPPATRVAHSRSVTHVTLVSPARSWLSSTACHHFERVAAQAQVMGYQQRREPMSGPDGACQHRAGTGKPCAIPRHDETEQHAAPADEHSPTSTGS